MLRQAVCTSISYLLPVLPVGRGRLWVLCCEHPLLTIKRLDLPACLTEDRPPSPSGAWKRQGCSLGRAVPKPGAHQWGKLLFLWEPMASAAPCRIKTTALHPATKAAAPSHLLCSSTDSALHFSFCRTGERGPLPDPRSCDRNTGPAAGGQ